MEHRTEEGDPLLKLRFVIVTHLNTGIQSTINYIHNTDGGDKKIKRKGKNGARRMVYGA